MSYTVLLVEDEVTTRMMTSRIIEKKLGLKVTEAANGKEALYFLSKDEAQEIDIILLDLNMPEMDGFEVLEKIAELRANLPVIVLTSSERLEDAVRATKLGAADFLSKPVEPERLHVSIQNALKINSLNQEVSRLRRKDANTLTFADLIGNDAGLADIVKTARKGAISDIPVFINGETGVGKELFARAIHGESQRFGAPFIAVNCAAIPEKLVESTLFGHEKGAFTGAVSSALGKFREAEAGTLFLDEVGELPLETQAKLLRVLQQKEIEPVGAGKSVSVNVRIISATNRDLAQEVAQGNFRDDLLFRLNVFPLAIPPLRQRRQDIIPLAHYFLNKFSASEKTGLKSLSAKAESLLIESNWLGNVRELENAIFRAVVLTESEQIDADDIQSSLSISAPASHEATPHNAVHLGGANINLKNAAGAFKSLYEIENELFTQVLQSFDGNVAKAAKALSVAKSTIYRKFPQ